MGKYKFGEDYFLYDEKLIEDLYKIRVCGIPLSFYLLDLRKTSTYCHLFSNFVAYFIDGAVRVEGEIDDVIGNDKHHSWIEINNGLVYDFTVGTSWKKESFYELNKPKNIIVYSKNQVREEIKRYLGHSENIPEVYVAFSRDIVENLDQCPLYKDVLREHVERFSKEKKLNEQKVNEKLVAEFTDELGQLYKQIEEFKNEALSEEIMKR